MSYEEQDVIWRVALASYDPREMRVWTRYLEERNPAIRCTGYRSSRTLLERLEQGDVDSALRRLLETLDETGTQTWRDFRKEYGLERRKVTIGRLLYALESKLSQQ